MTEDESTIRRVQAYTGERSLTVVLAKSFANQLKIEKGDYLKCHIEGNRLILEKAEI
jgi:antitoxin component of MazEF toxin-antitoxin module